MFPYGPNHSQQPTGSVPYRAFVPQHGVWSFDSNNLSGAQFRLYTETYGTPEVLFQVYNSGARDEIVLNARLKWFPGPQEEFKVSRIGTLAQHMAAMAEEMAILGLPPLQAHEIPMYPLSNGNPILLALRQGNRFEVATAIPHQSQNSLKGPMETQRRENGLQRHANGSFSTEPHRESSKQHTPSYDPTRKIQEIAPIATYATQAVTAQVEPSSSTNTPQRHHAGPVKLDNPTSPVATSQTPQRQLTTRPHPSSISPQQPSQPTPEPLVTTPDTPRNKQQEDPVRSKSFNNADLHPKPAHDASPNNLAAVPPNSSPVLEPQPQKHQEKIAVPESSIETRETLSTLAALAEVKSPSGRSKVRKWIQAQRGVSPFPIPEYGQELRAPIASDTNSRPILEPSNVLRVANSPLPVVSNSEAQNSRANAASTEGVDLKSDTESYVMVYTCDACQKPVMDQDTVQCDSCGSVQYCSHPCKRGQRLFHMPRCVGGNQPHASPLLGSIGEEPLTSSEADLSANLPNFDDEFPCFTCEGIKEHQLGCFIIEFRDGPRPKYDHTLLSELADKVKYFDPERWREHQNPVEPELEPFSEALAKSNEIIRREASYLNDPFLHVVPDRLLPLMWALRTSPRIQFQFMNEAGEIYAPDHPVWAEDRDEEQEGVSAGGSNTMEKKW